MAEPKKRRGSVMGSSLSLHRPGKRAANVARTRTRILGAVRQLLMTDGVDRINITSLVELAGVARSTIQYQFQSREQLMQELFRDAIRAADVDWMHPARDISDPGEAVEAMVVQACRAWSSDHLLFRRFMALAVIDEDTHRAAEALEVERQRGIDELVQRLTADEQIDVGAPRRRARSILSVATSFWTFDRLVEETLSRMEAAGILLELGRSILAPQTTWSFASA